MLLTCRAPVISDDMNASLRNREVVSDGDGGDGVAVSGDGE